MSEMGRQRLVGAGRDVSALATCYAGRPAENGQKLTFIASNAKNL